MQFYRECVRVANQVNCLFTEQQRALFINADLIALCHYQSPVGTWIQRHILLHNSYLRHALSALGYTEPKDMSLFLLEFTQQYLKLKNAELL